MAIALDELTAILLEFKISSIGDLRARLLMREQSPQSASSNWHDGYQEGFIKGSSVGLGRLDDAIERLGRRVEIVERDVGALARPAPSRRRKPAKSKRRK